MNDWHPAPLGLLGEIDQAIRQLLASADFDEEFPYIFGHPAEVGPETVVRSSNGLLLHKARLHLVAVLRAREQTNLHSVAVHTRVAMECAGQVASDAWAMHEGPPKGLKRLLNGREDDFRRAVLSSSRGQIDNQLINEMITSAREGIGLSDGKQSTTVKLTEKVSYLPDGREWYKFLSAHFCHPNLDVLSGPAHMGGVTARDARTIGAISVFLGLLARWLLDMLLANGFITIGAGGGDQLFNEAIELRQHWDALSASPSPTAATEFGYISVESEGSDVQVDDWDVACQWGLESLLELMKIHLAIDPPRRIAAGPEPEYMVRLRKVQFHVRAVILWPITPEAVHVMGPDIRAAREQLDEIIQDSGMLYGSVAASVKRSKKQLEPFSHPTTGTVWQSLSLGGFGKDRISWRAWLALLLMGLVVDYALCLGEAADLLNPSVAPQLLRVIEDCPRPAYDLLANTP